MRRWPTSAGGAVYVSQSCLPLLCRYLTLGTYVGTRWVGLAQGLQSHADQVSAFHHLLFSPPGVSDSLRPHGLQHAWLPVPHHLLEFAHVLVHRWCHPAMSSSVVPFTSYPQSFLASGTFPVSWLFISDDQNTAASASVLPVSIHGWFPLRSTGWSLRCPRDFQKSSSAPQFEGISSLVFRLLCGSTLTTLCDHWEERP